MPNPEDITDPTTAMNMTLALMAKSFKISYSTPTNNNKGISSNPRNRQIAQPRMNMRQDRHMQMVIKNAVQNPRIQNVRNQNGQIAVPGNANQNPNGNGNLVASRAEGNATGHNENQIRCYKCRGVGHFARNYITDKAPIYDLNGSAEVHNYENCDDNEIFNMFTQEEQYTELLEPIPKPHQIPHNDNYVTFEVFSVEQSGGTVEQHPANVEETRALYDSLYNNLEIEVEKINTVNRKLRETNAELTTELARFKIQEKCFEINQEKYDKLERCYQKSVYQEQCLSKKINALHLSSDELLDKQIQLEKKIKELDNILVKTGQSIQMIYMLSPKPNSFYHTKQKMALGYQNPFYLKQAQQKQQSLYDGTVLLEKHDPPVVHDSKETLQLAQENFKSLAKEVDESLVKHKALELEIERLLRAVVSDQKDNTRGTSANTKFAKQSIMGKLPKVGETHALSKPVTSNSIPTTQGSKVMKNNKVTAPGIFRINPFKTYSEGKYMPNKDNTKTRRPQPRSNTNNDRVPSASKSSRSKNKEVEVEEHHRKLLLPRNKKHMSFECNNVKLATQNIKVVCAMCKQCLISVNHDPKVKKTKKVGSIKRLASPRPSKPRSFLRWSPTGRMLDLKGKIIAYSESESQPDCSKGDNACTSNPLEPTIKRFPNSTFFLAGNPTMFMVCQLGLFKAYDRESKASHKFCLEFLGTVRFENDHVAAILGFGDFQWGNILITRVYFIEGLGHNLFSVRKFCNSDLEVAFRRNACFVRNLEGVDLLKGNRSTNLYTINLHEMASVSPICLMARTSSTKSWLWHQRKRKRASHPPKPVPNSRQRLHLLHMDLCGPMRIASINGKWALCYPKNDHEDIGKLGAKGDIGFFIGYSANSCAFRVQISSGLDLTYAPSTMTTQQLTKGALDLLFEAMYDDYISGQSSVALRTVPAVQAHQDRQTPTSTSIADTASTPTSASSQATIFPNTSQHVSTIEPKNVKEAMTDPAWIKSMQEELLQFKRLDQAPRAWYDELFIRRFVDDILVVQVYVDDIIFGSTHPKYTQLFSDLMKSRFEISMMGEMTFFFGLQVNQSPCAIFINKSNYVLEIPKKYGMESCDFVGTPMEIKDKLDLDQNGTPVDATKYRSMIGALMYLTSSRPDIDSGFELTGFSDADYVGCKDTFKSTYGRVQFLAIAISCNLVQHSRTKHIAVCYHFIKEHVEKGTIELYFVKTDYQLADLFTKALPADQFNYLVRCLGMRSLSAQELDRLAKSQ
nr:hypothetical protein [Tanacetum cinerariifolium]